MIYKHIKFSEDSSMSSGSYKNRCNSNLEFNNLCYLAMQLVSVAYKIVYRRIQKISKNL